MASASEPGVIAGGAGALPGARRRCEAGKRTHGPGTRACLALLAATALLALAAPAQAQTEIWSATLTPQDLGMGALGCNSIDFNTAVLECSNTAVLSDNDFTLGSTDHTIEFIELSAEGSLQIISTGVFTDADTLVLVLGTTSLAFSDGLLKSGDGQLWDGQLWVSTGISWTVGTAINVKLTAATPPVTNAAPTVANAIQDQTATVGTALSYAFPANTFADTDAGDTLTYTATQSDDTALPSWLSFAAATRTFSGTPTAADVGTVSVKVTASDGHGGSVSDTFDIVVSAAPNTLATGAPTITGTAQVGQTLTAGTTAIMDADGLTSVSYTYQWIRVATDNTETNISSATTSTYMLVAADQGTTVKVRVSFTDDASNAETLTSAATAAVAAAANTLATGAPTITGTAQVGQTLTAGTTAIMDADGLTSPTYTYQWIRVDGTDEEDISGENSSTYILVDADLGTTVKVTVSFTDDASNSETLTSAATAAVAAAANTAATGAPTITGTAQVGETLTASTTGIADANGLTTPGYTYQWIRVNGTEADIAGENSSTYILVDADLGKTIKVKVSFTDDASNSETLTSAATAAVAAAANTLATGAPTITGTAQVGQTLTAGTTAIMDADGLTSPTYTYQWIRVDGTDEEDISGENSSTYILVDADLGTTVKVTVSFTDDASNSETLTSAATAAVAAAANTAATGAPTITGTAQVGETLTASTTGIADANGLTTPGYTYQWIRVNGTEADIAGENSSTYILVDADLGKTIKVKVSFTDDASNSETLTSAATAAVAAAANTAATGAPTITGTAQVGQTLTAGTTAIMDADGLTSVSYTYQWIRVATDNTETNISSATASTYTLEAADQGTTVKVTVSFTDDANNPETLTSAATAAVSAAANTLATGAPTITGTAQIGQTLTAGTTAIMDADGLTSVSYTYQWIRVATDNTETNISSATASTYTLVAADQGTTVKVTVSFTDDANNPETLTSAATAAVSAAPNTLATGAPTITGTAQVGQTLTASTTGIADANGLTTPNYTYQWIRVDGTDEADIASANSSTYPLGAADLGTTLKVRVTFADDLGHTETLTSAATATVTATPAVPTREPEPEPEPEPVPALPLLGQLLLALGLAGAGAMRLVRAARRP